MRELIHQIFLAYLRLSPSHRGKERLLDCLWRPLSFRRYQRVRRLKGTHIVVDCDLTKWIQRHLYFFGEYESEACFEWAERARSADTIFDIGANVGVYSLFAAESNPNAHIYAFEPTPEVFSSLERNIAANQFANITVYRAAVGIHSGVTYLHRCGGIDGANEGMNYVSSDRASLEQVETTTLDDFCANQRIRRIDLLKIDVEGGEFDVLRGARTLLQQQRIDCIFLELVEWTANRGGHSTNGIAELLRKFGYGLHKLVKKKLVPLQPNETSIESVIAFPALRSTGS